MLTENRLCEIRNATSDMASNAVVAVLKIDTSCPDITSWIIAAPGKAISLQDDPRIKVIRCSFAIHNTILESDKWEDELERSFLNAVRQMWDLATKDNTENNCKVIDQIIAEEADAVAR